MPYGNENQESYDLLAAPGKFKGSDQFFKTLMVMKDQDLKFSSSLCELAGWVLL